jgi:hypothetical protein
MEEEMKVRLGFVSNSSSSSFVVALSVLKQSDIDAIMNYAESEDNHDAWTIRKEDFRGVICGWTILDNNSIRDFIRDELGEDVFSLFIFNEG